MASLKVTHYQSRHIFIHFLSMVLNWARFRQVLETAPERRLDSVMDNIEFLKDFMFQLSQVTWRKLFMFDLK